MLQRLTVFMEIKHHALTIVNPQGRRSNKREDHAGIEEGERRIAAGPEPEQEPGAGEYSNMANLVNLCQIWQNGPFAPFRSTV